MLGLTFGRWRVEADAGRNARNRDLWECRCKCGTLRTVLGGYLRSGRSKSCGCSGDEKFAERNTTHGLSGSPEHNAWKRMKSRCSVVTDKSYPDYGGRGIKVCPEWEASFNAFISDMGPRPSPAHSLERVDNSKGYSPNNCIWGTKVEQARNARPRRGNTTGLSGTQFIPPRTWRVRIHALGRNFYIGTFQDFFEACCARKSAEHLYWS